MAKVLIKTTEGDIKVRLYDETPQHRDNFLKLAKEGYFDGTLFHRVIKDFMARADLITPSLPSLFIHSSSTSAVP